MKDFDVKKFIPCLMLLVSLTTFGSVSFADSTGELEKEVADTERAFPKTMADRGFEAFKSFISDEAVFWSVSSPLELKEAVLAFWKAYYEGPDAMFVWQPETVVALEKGDLTLSKGPVLGPDNIVNAYYNSIWRKMMKVAAKKFLTKGNPTAVQNFTPQRNAEARPKMVLLSFLNPVRSFLK
jgi:hypothetical protein